MKPFDLEAAKAGAPLVTRDGRKAKFIAYVPECNEDSRVVILVDGDGYVSDYAESGNYYEDDCKSGNDLFMCEEEKKPVVRWLWADEHGYLIQKMYSEEEARHGLVKIESTRTEFPA